MPTWSLSAPKEGYLTNFWTSNLWESHYGNCKRQGLFYNSLVNDLMVKDVMAVFVVAYGIMFCLLENYIMFILYDYNALN